MPEAKKVQNLFGVERTEKNVVLTGLSGYTMSVPEAVNLAAHLLVALKGDGPAIELTAKAIREAAPNR